MNARDAASTAGAGALRLAAGAFVGGTVGWIALALATPGDFVAGGRPLALLVVVVASVAGALAARRARSRAARAGLLVGGALCALFWTVVPDGWWATAPPATATPAGP